MDNRKAQDICDRIMREFPSVVAYPALCKAKGDRRMGIMLNKAGDATEVWVDSESAAKAHARKQ